MEDGNISSNVWNVAFPISNHTNEDDHLFNNTGCRYTKSNIKKKDYPPAQSNTASDQLEDKNKLPYIWSYTMDVEQDRSLSEVLVESSNIISTSEYSPVCSVNKKKSSEFSELVAENASLLSKFFANETNTLCELSSSSPTFNSSFDCSTPKPNVNDNNGSAGKYKIDSKSIWCENESNKLELSRSDVNYENNNTFSNSKKVLSNETINRPFITEQISVRGQSSISPRNRFKKTLSGSSSDFMDKLSLIDVDKNGLNSLLSMPSCDSPTGGKCNIDISPMTEKTDKSSIIPCNENTSKNVSSSSANNSSRIPRPIHRRPNLQDTNFRSQSGDRLHDASSVSKSSSITRSFSSDRLPTTASFASPASSLLSSHTPSARDATNSRTMLRQYSKSTLTLAGSKNTNGDASVTNSLIRSLTTNMDRSSSVSMSSLPSHKRADYRHVKSKVRQYIRDVKGQRPPRRTPPSGTSSPCSTSPASIFLLNEDLLDQMDSELPSELRTLVNELESLSGTPHLLRTLLRVLLQERRTRSDHEQTMATLQLDYDNLLAKHAHSQNLIDKLRLSSRSCCSPPTVPKRVTSPDDSLQTSNHVWSAKLPCHDTDRQRRHSLAWASPQQFRGLELSVSQSQPDLIKATSVQVIEPNLGLSFDDSGSLCLLPTPFESNTSIPLAKVPLTIVEASKYSECFTSIVPSDCTDNSTSHLLADTNIMYKDMSTLSKAKLFGDTGEVTTTDLPVVGSSLNLPNSDTFFNCDTKSVSIASANRLASAAKSADSSTVESTSVNRVVNAVEHAPASSAVEHAPASSAVEHVSAASASCAVEHVSAASASCAVEHVSAASASSAVEHVSAATASSAVDDAPASSAVEDAPTGSVVEHLHSSVLDLAHLLTCGGVTKDEAHLVWCGLLQQFAGVAGSALTAADGAKISSLHTALQILARKFSLNLPQEPGYTPPAQYSNTCGSPVGDVPEVMRELDFAALVTQGRPPSHYDDFYSSGDVRPFLTLAQEATPDDGEDNITDNCVSLHGVENPVPSAPGDSLIVSSNEKLITSSITASKLSELPISSILFTGKYDVEVKNIESMDVPGLSSIFSENDEIHYRYQSSEFVQTSIGALKSCPQIVSSSCAPRSSDSNAFPNSNAIINSTSAQLAHSDHNSQVNESTQCIVRRGIEAVDPASRYSNLDKHYTTRRSATATLKTELDTLQRRENSRRGDRDSGCPVSDRSIRLNLNVANDSLPAAAYDTSVLCSSGIEETCRNIASTPINETIPDFGLSQNVVTYIPSKFSRVSDVNFDVPMKGPLHYSPERLLHTSPHPDVREKTIRRPLESSQVLNSSNDHDVIVQHRLDRMQRDIELLRKNLLEKSVVVSPKAKSLRTRTRRAPLRAVLAYNSTSDSDVERVVAPRTSDSTTKIPFVDDLRRNNIDNTTYKKKKFYRKHLKHRSRSLCNLPSAIPPDTQTQQPCYPSRKRRLRSRSCPRVTSSSRACDVCGIVGLRRTTTSDLARCSSLLQQRIPTSLNWCGCDVTPRSTAALHWASLHDTALPGTALRETALHRKDHYNLPDSCSSSPPPSCVSYSSAREEGSASSRQCSQCSDELMRCLDQATVQAKRVHDRSHSLLQTLLSCSRPCSPSIAQ